MHPEIGATELLVIAAVALIVVGPKDLPLLLRKLGQFMGKLRNMANDFRASFDEMARQSELDELRAEVEAMRKGQIAELASLDASHADAMRDINDGLSGVRFPPTPLPPEPVAEPTPPVTAKIKPAPKPRAPRKPTVEGGEAPKPAAKPAAAPKKAPAKPRKAKSGTVT
jgi:sec-independent protein translocase protein TatB